VPLIDAEHSLLIQSARSQLGTEPMNGDGFGVGWYAHGLPEPALFRDVRPAWNDENFRDLATHTRSAMFMAHIRATTGTSVQRSNCHPFRAGRWLFQHNGLIPDFEGVRRELLFDVPAEHFPGIRGTTDSEIIFHLALGYGLDTDAPSALARAAGHVERAMRDNGIDGEFHFSAAAANGDSIHAVRYASTGTPRTLFYADDLEVLKERDPTLVFPEGSIVVVSEPLGDLIDWEEVPPGSLITAGAGGVEIRGFEPC
jgi:glutamine amidotransferase